MSHQQTKNQEAVAAHAAHRITQLANGVELLKEWLGDGATPVAQGVAELRARQCETCQFNHAGLKPIRLVAQLIHRHVESKNQASLRVPNEDKLHTCEVCYCHLPLKVHVPLDVIVSKTSDETMARFKSMKPDCWILNHE